MKLHYDPKAESLKARIKFAWRLFWAKPVTFYTPNEVIEAAYKHLVDKGLLKEQIAKSRNKQTIIRKPLPKRTRAWRKKQTKKNLGKKKPR